MSTILITIVVMAALGLLAAVILYFIAKRFSVYEDPKIEEIEQLLPGANCGGCGCNGCHDFAVACSKASSLDNLCCPGSDASVMQKIAEITGLAANTATKRMAVVCCNGSCENRPHTSTYDGVKTCAIEHSLYTGETDCSYGCLGCGDCVKACTFDALELDENGLPCVNYDKCVGCGKCAEACPRNIIEIVDKNNLDKYVFVACRNKEKGAVAMKECNVSCIGCGRCKKSCPGDAITVTEFLAHIDQDKCTRCGECVDACLRKSIRLMQH